MTALSAKVFRLAGEFMQEVFSAGRVKPKRIKELKTELDIDLWRFLNCLMGMQAVFVYGDYAVKAGDFCDVTVHEGVGYVTVETYNDDHDLLALLEAAFDEVGLKGEVSKIRLQSSGRRFCVTVPAEIVQRFVDAADAD